MAKRKVMVQHVTEGNELYWEEVLVEEAELDEGGAYKGKPLKGTIEGLEKTHGKPKR